jgi:putative ABC transport system permease protein
MSSTGPAPHVPAPGWPVWRLLLTFSWQEWRHHAVRNSMAVVAVMLGVALAFSVHLINQSAVNEFSTATRAATGQADLSVRAARGLMGEAIYPQLARDAQVATASPVVELMTQALDPHGQSHTLRIIGLDALVAYPIAPTLVPQFDNGEDRHSLLSPDTIALNASARRLLKVKPGDVLSVQSAQRIVPLRVMGTVSAPGSPVGVMDIAGAQSHFGKVGGLSRVDLQLQPGASVQSLQASLALPPGILIETPGDNSLRVSGASRAYRVNLTVLALVALFTGAFLVFSILSLSVAKRQQQLALLGVLGLSARERMQLVLLESAVVGVLGTALGLAMGTGLAAMAMRLLAGDLGGGYFPGIAPQLQWSTSSALAYGLLGVCAALLGGWLPARHAQTLAPAQALKGQGMGVKQQSRVWLGMVLLIMGVALANAPAIDGVPWGAYLGVACLLLGGIACVPATVGGLLWLVPRTRHAPTLLAVERARRVRHTATVTMAGVVASLSLSVALTVMVSSFRGSVSHWLDTILPADLYVRTGSGTDQADSLHLAPQLPAAVERIPGVARVVGLRISPLTLRAGQSPIEILARPVDDPQDTLPLVGALLPARTGMINVFVSEAMVDLYDAQPGRTLMLPMRAGQPLVATYVRGVWRDYARQSGSIVMTLTDYRSATGDNSLTNLAIWLQRGQQTEPVEQAIRAAARQQGMSDRLLEFGETNDIRETTMSIFDRSFAVTYWLQAVAIAIGLFGTAASFSAQVLARRKEFGLLAHLGFSRQQVLGIVAGEGLALTTVGALMGLALGLAVSVVLIHVVNPQSFHWTMDMIAPWERLTALCAGVVLAGTLTAVIAGHKAVGEDAVMAVKEDW